MLQRCFDARTDCVSGRRVPLFGRSTFAPIKLLVLLGEEKFFETLSFRFAMQFWRQTCFYRGFFYEVYFGAV